ncbi:structural maintenance of chromosomes protein 5 [Microplitis demolitor]|uniref:structural maintenance of chromosomes protein 5 n=1 Tax=Microplitis demolitor TaxID=69319 RepID=UPI00235B6872|nr:structural maintenance of chromosomes protein 5 [Microplitis demolitor]
MPGEKFQDKGIIRKIYLKDFITYSEAVVTPGRNLNMVIGPNGSGKSTLVSALALGLGATPKTLGKPGHISQYIRTGCQKAYIEIHIQQTINKIIKISRTFTSENKTTWMIDGHPVIESKIRDVIQDFNIQVENLCQFLPQERVSDFSKMDSRQLLLNTEKSVGDPRLHNYHMQLIELRSAEEKMEAEIQQKKSKLDVETKTLKGLEESVSSIRERTALSKKLKTLKQKKAWLKYDDARKVITETKEERDKAYKELEQLRKTLGPTNELMVKKKSDIKKLENLVNSHSGKINEHEYKLNNIIEALDNFHYKVNECKKECSNEIEHEKLSDKEIKKSEIRKNKLENDMRLMIDELGSEELIKKRYQESERKFSCQKKIIDEYSDEITRLKNDSIKIKNDIAHAQRYLDNLKDVDSKRMDVLRNISNDAYEGVKWLRSNLDKFRGKIHEPMLLTLQLDHNDHAKYVERVIAQRDLLAFVCENKDDMNLLLKYLREDRKLIINAVHSDPNKPYDNRPYIPLDQIRQFGFQHYLIEFIEAPLTIMKYLVQMYQIHNIPVGTAAVEDNPDRIPDNLQLYFSPNNCYSVRKSKYTGDKSTSISRLGAARAFNINLDTSKIQENEQKIVELNYELDNNNQEMLTVCQHYQEENKKLDELRITRTKYRSEVNQIQKLESEINVAKSKLQKLKNERKSIDEIKAITKEKIMRMINKQIDYYTECNKLYEKVVSMATQSNVDSLKLKMMQQELLKLSNESLSLRERLEAADAHFSDLDRQVKEMKIEIDKFFEAALAETNGMNPQDPKFQSLHKAFKKLPSNLSDIEKAIQASNAKLYCLANNDNGEQILREYDRLKQDIDRLNNETQELNDKLKINQDQITKIHDDWLPLINTLVEQIDKNFSTYFASVGCVGEVKFNVPDNIKNYEMYALQISVKFRDTDQLQIFDQQRQSGGEKAFTTAIYMLSLQELCNVPFRCVDEINQGMDPVYERRVMDLLVELTMNKKGSQYFLITPKILPNLHYNDNCRIHVVHNGPFVVSNDKFNMQNFCSRLIT